MGRIVGIKELRPGDLIKGRIGGLVVKTNEPDDFHGGAGVRYIDWHDPYFGVCWTSANEDNQYEIAHERGTDEYKDEINRLIKERSQHITDAENDIKFMQECL